MHRGATRTFVLALAIAAVVVGLASIWIGFTTGDPASEDQLRVGRWAQRNPMLAVSSVATLVLLVAGLIGSLVTIDRLNERDRATQTAPVHHHPERHFDLFRTWHLANQWHDQQQILLPYYRTYFHLEANGSFAY